MVSTLKYDFSYLLEGEDVGMDIAAVHVEGHGHALEDLEYLLYEIELDCPYSMQSTTSGWNIVETYLRTVPRGDYSAHVYCGKGRGAKQITALLKKTSTTRWCHFCIYEPWYTCVNMERNSSLRNRIEENPDGRVTLDENGFPYICKKCYFDLEM